MVDLSVLGDTERPAALLRLAHPDFRDDLEKTWREGQRRA